ncbi:MAG: hypothetical protein GEV11_14235 [Streptosporangiales bacterium]|nr:hypothetical protein [Streptosporangiales bacterium]
MSKRHDSGGRSGHLPNEVVELAVIFVAAGAVHLLTTAAGHAAYGPTLLMVIGATVVITMMIGRRLLARRRAATAPPEPDAAPAPDAEKAPDRRPATPVCVECGAVQETVLLRLDPVDRAA